ncbi:MAG: DUF4402 domain-containing protein [Kiloniellaceae bacterium]
MMVRLVTRGLAFGSAVVALALVFGGPQAAADAGRAMVRATVLKPVSFANVSGMNFGTLMPNGETGVVALLPNGKFTAQGVDVARDEEVKSATFKILGEDNQAYTITLPSAATFTNGRDGISVMTFVHDAGWTPTLDPKGYGHFNIGATLKLRWGQTAGVYSGSVDVVLSNN